MHEHVFVVGGQRCGTTYLAALLDDHPEIRMAHGSSGEPKALLTDEPDPSAYDRYWFGGPSAARVYAEKSTTYLETPAVAERIARLFPTAKVVAVVREPVRRAASNHRFTVANGLEDRPLEVALTESLAGVARPYDQARFSASPYAYLERGRYAEHLEAYTRCLGRERVGVFIFEELVAGAGTLAEIYAFLGVDPGHRPARLGQVYNASEGAPVGVPPSHDDRFATHTNGIGRIAEWSAIPVSTDLRAALAAYYREPNQALVRLLGREPPWDTAA